MKTEDSTEFMVKNTSRIVYIPGLLISKKKSSFCNAINDVMNDP
jgi:hypothetical protein